VSQAHIKLLYRFPLKVRRPFVRMWYEYISGLDRDADVIFMNYGWASLDPEAEPLTLRPEDETNRYCIQLYHRVASAVDLRGLDVLEVGCGRGGGAAYVARYLGPRSMTGLDLAAKAIEFCQRHYAIPGLTFVQGDAEALEFAADTFDVVINIESSHCYAAMSKFLIGVHRVLRPGGYFLFADLRKKEHIKTLRRQFKDSGLTVLKEETINDNVIKALELDNARKEALIKRKVPRVFQPLFCEFAGIEGTFSRNASFRSGDLVYLLSVLRKESR